MRTAVLSDVHGHERRLPTPPDAELGQSDGRPDVAHVLVTGLVTGRVGAVAVA